MKRKSLDKALFKKENKVLNKLNYYGVNVREVSGYILAIFLMGVLIYLPMLFIILMF